MSHLVLWKTSLASKIRFEALWQSKAVRRCINWCLVAFARLVGAFFGLMLIWWLELIYIMILLWVWWCVYKWINTRLFSAIDERFNDDYDPSIGGYGGNGEDKIVLIHVVFYRLHPVIKQAITYGISSNYSITLMQSSLKIAIMTHLYFLNKPLFNMPAHLLFSVQGNTSSRLSHNLLLPKSFWPSLSANISC